MESTIFVKEARLDVFLSAKSAEISARFRPALIHPHFFIAHLRFIVHRRDRQGIGIGSFIRNTFVEKFRCQNRF